jgi:hypothetical protein
MPRFTPWRPDAAPDQDADLLREVVVRPSLHQAFPLPSGDSPGEERFRKVLDALAQQSGLDRKAGLQGG